MKWRVYLCSALFVFLGLFVGTFILNQKNNVFASQLCTFTFNSSNLPNNSIQYCDDYLSDIKYVEFDFGVDSSVHSMSFNYNTFSVSNSGGRSYFLWFFNSISYSYIQYANGVSDSYPLIVSFYDSFPSTSVLPSGSISISQNGTYDVTNYSQAVVNVENEVIYGDYHDDLVSINNTIMIGCAIPLVIYFFYCIYRMLLKGRI